jgi:hypothetical protein
VNGPGRGAKRDRLVSNVRNWTVASAIAAFILLWPIVAFLTVITAEMLIDIGIEARATAICAAAAGAIVWVLFRKNRPHFKGKPQLGQDEVCDETATAASGM